MLGLMGGTGAGVVSNTTSRVCATCQELLHVFSHSRLIISPQGRSYSNFTYYETEAELFSNLSRSQ